MLAIAYIGFGANLGDPESTFDKAIEKIEALDNVAVTNVSSLYKTDPVGLQDDGPEFLNAVLEIQIYFSRAITFVATFFPKGPLDFPQVVYQVKRRE